MSSIDACGTEFRVAHRATKLFCFPHAGGTAALFRDWNRALAPMIEVCPVEFPGHASRFNERAFDSIEPLVDCLFKDIKKCADAPIALFGHSMGAIVAFELALRFQSHWERELGILIVSGCGTPAAGTTRRAIHDLPDAEFIEELKLLNGTPSEVLGDQELLSSLFPVIRSDFRLMHSYRYTPMSSLACPIIVLGGTEDTEVLPEQLSGWSELTTGRCLVELFPGDHFFLRNCESELLHFIKKQIELCLVK